MSEAADELFLMTNLYPASTGLPMVIWVGPSYGAPHDARIEVMQAHGTRMDPSNLAVVAVRSPASSRRLIFKPSSGGSR
jgi:hypothetical protein